MNHRSPGFALLSIAFVLAVGACRDGNEGTEVAKLLDFGDAEWDRPPFAPPGGNGAADGGEGGGEGGGPSPGEDGAADGTGGWDDGWTDPTTGDSTTGASTTGDSTTGDSTTGTAGSDTAGSGTAGSDTAGSDTAGSSSSGAPAVPRDGDAPAMMCPAEREPAIYYMSNDDSNSQASPVLARHTVLSHQIVAPNRIRIHEFLNYYDMSHDNPHAKAASVGLQMRRTDAALGEFVLLAQAQGQHLDAADRRPMNLVFSLDTSGSMSGPPIERLRDTMRSIAGSLRAGDVVSVVEWSQSQSVPLASHMITGPSDPVLVGVIDAVVEGGSTDLEGGLRRAYELANDNYAKDRINRVVLISDGGANTGITDISLIAGQAADRDGEGIYLVGVGVGESRGYRDELMDEVTDAGKGAYVFIDSRSEADRMFGAYFVQNMTVAARNVQMELTMPWYFAITEFHGEEYSKNPAEVEPQHLGFSDAMSFHQLITACDPTQIYTSDRVKAKVTYQDPITGTTASEELELPIGEIVRGDATQLYKGDVVVAYAQAFIVIGDHAEAGDMAAAKQVALDMVQWLEAAFETLADPEIEEMRDIMAAYAADL